MKKYLLFDLDGTLTDPKVGITTSVQYALRAFGIEEPDIDKLESFIGPPLRDSFMGFYDMSAEQAEEAVAKYRERFQDIGIFENEVYEGIPHILNTLQRHGMVLAVASSKPQVYVERILDHFDLRKYFAVIVGSELDGTRESKDEVVQEALRLLFGDEEVQRDQVYMIGDRKFDVEGAKALRVESVAVTYGYGTMEELKAAKADYIVQSVEELERFLMRGADEENNGAGGSGGKLYQTVRTMLFASIIYMLLRVAAAYLLAAAGCESFVGQIVGFAAVGIALFGTAKKLIRKTAEDTRLMHLKKARLTEYLQMALAALGSAFGLNLLAELTQITAGSETFQEVAESQYSVPFLAGLFLYGIVSPVAEELLFRGIFHNSLRRFLSPGLAIAASSALFGLYHMNLVQGIYGFWMGCIIAYAYEYFGKFGVAVAVHAGVNFLVYCLTYTGSVTANLLSWVVCAALLLLSAGSLWMLNRHKRVL